jgi:hypothetical protein
LVIGRKINTRFEGRSIKNTKEDSPSDLSHGLETKLNTKTYQAGEKYKLQRTRRSPGGKQSTCDRTQYPADADLQQNPRILMLDKKVQVTSEGSKQ